MDSKFYARVIFEWKYFFKLICVFDNTSDRISLFYKSEFQKF